MSTYSDISEIRQDYRDGKFSYHEDVAAKVPADHVWDENKTVKENREMTEAHNKQVDEGKKRVRDKQNALFAEMREAVVRYIMDTSDLPHDLASKVESFVYAEHHSYMEDYFSSINEMADFANVFYVYGKQAGTPSAI